MGCDDSDSRPDSRSCRAGQRCSSSPVLTVWQREPTGIGGHSGRRFDERVERVHKLGLMSESSTERIVRTEPDRHLSSFRIHCVGQQHPSQSRKLALSSCDCEVFKRSLSPSIRNDYRIVAYLKRLKAVTRWIRPRSRPISIQERCLIHSLSRTKDVVEDGLGVSWAAVGGVRIEESKRL